MDVYCQIQCVVYIRFWLTDEQKFKQTSEPRSDGILSTLEIYNFVPADIGNYSCEVTNEFGDASESVFVDGSLNIVNGEHLYSGSYTSSWASLAAWMDTVFL